MSTPTSKKANVETIKKFYSERGMPEAAFDNLPMTYDLERYNWPELFLSIARESKPSLAALEDIHLHYSLDDFVDLRKKYEHFTTSQEFCKLVDQFVKEYLEPKIPRAQDRQYMIQQIAGIRIVIPDQRKVGRLLTFHTGYWTGYNNLMYTCWIPVSRAFDSNSMQVMNWEESKRLMIELHENEYSLERIQDMCEKQCYPVCLMPGEAWLFNQGHLHGNINNDTGISRVSFDIRVAVKGHGFGGARRAGSFFRFPGESGQSNLENINANGRWIVFVDQNSEFIYPTPHYMIREFLIGHVSRYGIKPTDWKNEYWFCQWMPHLYDLITQGNVDGIVVPSIYAFSLPRDRMLEFFQTALEQQVQILFVDEHILLNDNKDLEKIIRLYEFTKDDQSNYDFYGTADL